MILKILLKELNKEKFFLLFWVTAITLAMSLINMSFSKSIRGALASLAGAALISLGVFMAISIVENYESRQHGYNFMLLMPVKLLDIMTAKFLSILIILGISVSVVVPFVLASGIESFTYSAVMISIQLAMILGGFFHLGIARLGFEKCLNIFLFGSGTAGFVILLIFRIAGGTKNFEILRNFAKFISTWPMMAVSLIIYFLLMIITAKVKAKYLNR